MAAIEIIALIMAGLVVVLIAGMLSGWWTGKATKPAPTVTLLRLTGLRSNHEELRLLVNDRLIHRVSDEATRAAEYQAQVDELEKLASSLSTALGVEIYLRRADVHEHPEYENGKI
jgi:hypothetical protein